MKMSAKKYFCINAKIINFRFHLMAHQDTMMGQCKLSVRIDSHLCPGKFVCR